MKKLLSIVTVLIIASVGLSAQVISSQLSAMNGPLSIVKERTVVRNIEGEYVFGFAVDTSLGYDRSFFYMAGTSDLTSTMNNSYWYQIPINVMVNDIFIDGSDAYFCGMINGANPLYGHIALPTPLSPMSITVEYRFSFDVDDELYRIVRVQGALTGTMVASIGRNRIYVDDMVASSLRTYDVNEELYDITQDGSRLYFWGSDLVGNALSLRVCSSSTLLSDPLLGTVHRYTLAGNTVAASCCATRLPDGTMAVAHQLTEGDNHFLDLAVIDPVTLMCVRHHSVPYPHRVHFHGMCYLSSTQTLVTLFRDPTTGTTPFVEWQPFVNTSYIVNMVQSDWRFTSLDATRPDVFIAVGRNQWFLQRTLPSSWSLSCLPISTVPAVVRPVHTMSTLSSLSAITSMTTNTTVLPHIILVTL